MRSDVLHHAATQSMCCHQAATRGWLQCAREIRCGVTPAIVYVPVYVRVHTGLSSPPLDTQPLGVCMAATLTCACDEWFTDCSAHTSDSVTVPSIIVAVTDRRTGHRRRHCRRRIRHPSSIVSPKWSIATAPYPAHCAPQQIRLHAHV
eukprot:gene11684-biopygen7527